MTSEPGEHAHRQVSRKRWKAFEEYRKRAVGLFFLTARRVDVVSPQPMRTHGEHDAGRHDKVAGGIFGHDDLDQQPKVHHQLSESAQKLFRAPGTFESQIFTHMGAEKGRDAS